MGDLRFRPARPTDAAELTALMHASTTYRGTYASILAGIRVTPDYLATDPTVVVADGQAILGFYSIIPDPPELDLLFVADHAQGRGIGRQLVGHMLHTAARDGLRTVRVVSHPPAEGFYLTLGARRVGTVGPKPPKVTWSRPDLIFDVPLFRKFRAHASG